MLKIEDIEKIKSSFYGWEYCVDKRLSPTITHEDIELLSNVFIDLEEQQKEIEKLKAEKKYYFMINKCTNTLNINEQSDEGGNHLREIKFRVWDIEDKVMYQSPKELKHLGKWLDTHLPGALADENNIILLQYTGLKDKNDKEIYEKDVVYFNDFAYDRTGGHVGDNILNGEVEFSSGGWIIKTEKGVYDLYSSIENDEELEVIGNIYENEELF